MEWDVSAIQGPEGADWRVPVEELTQRLSSAASALSEAGLESMLIHDPVDLYWLTGGRQNGVLLVGGAESSVDSVFWVRASYDRAAWEAGGSDAPFEIANHPPTRSLNNALSERGCTTTPALQHGRIPHNQVNFYQKIIGESPDCTKLLYSLRESKSDWEIEQMRASGEVNRWMFEAILDEGGEGVSEIELAAAADSVSRAAGFGGHIMMRKWPMNCDRVVITAGNSGAVPSYFDSAVGGTGPHPFASLGAGFNRIKPRAPVSTGLVHC
ncbi:MAG: aminopeptidase P family N-terminal domain-containing protein, partial [Euryarchaeota archaeon]|nr:aminopeptidase P family N-terminal domain-containing protein [Euryarchaeota archaeon]